MTLTSTLAATVAFVLVSCGSTGENSLSDASDANDASQTRTPHTGSIFISLAAMDSYTTTSSDPDLSSAGTIPGNTRGPCWQQAENLQKALNDYYDALDDYFDLEHTLENIKLAKADRDRFQEHLDSLRQSLENAPDEIFKEHLRLEIERAEMSLESIDAYIESALDGSTEEDLQNRLRLAEIDVNNAIKNGKAAEDAYNYCREGGTGGGEETPTPTPDPTPDDLAPPQPTDEPPVPLGETSAPSPVYETPSPAPVYEIEPVYETPSPAPAYEIPSSEPVYETSSPSPDSGYYGESSYY